MRTPTIWCCLSLLLLSHVSLALAHAAGPKRTSEEVLLVFNANSPVSTAIAQDYLKQRHVKDVVAVKCQDSALITANETMPLSAYRDAIETPIRAYVSRHPKIEFIVLTKGIPIRIGGAPWGSCGFCDEKWKGPKEIQGRPSVDSSLAALDYTNLPGALTIDITGSGAVGLAYSNRFWNATEPFSHAKFGGYLVSRLDGYTEAQAKALVAQALEAERNRGSGKVLLDVQPSFGLGDKKTQPGPIESAIIQRESAWNEFNADMIHAHDVLAARGIPDELDLTEAFMGHRSGLLGYFSWGSNDAKYASDAYNSLAFAPGSLSDTAVSTSARTFLPTQGGQSLLADLIAQGLTCGKGYVDEPLLQAIASPTIALDRYTSGWTMVESFYAASHFVGWEDIVVGDPLCAPYR